MEALYARRSIIRQPVSGNDYEGSIWGQTLIILFSFL